MTHARPDYVLMWLDLETSGLDPYEDGIIEVAWQLTDRQLEPLTDMRSRLVWPGTRVIERWHANEFVADMHRASGLTADWRAEYGQATQDRTTHLLPTSVDVGRLIVADINETVDTRTVRIAGSGVSHFDMAFIRRRVGPLHDRLDWRPMDVGQIEEWFELVGIPPYEAPEGGPAKTHRAADDIRYHQAEARYYLDVLRGL